MKTAIITGSLGLVGSEAVHFIATAGFRILGVDNDMRRHFFGDEASTEWNRKILEEKYPSYNHFSWDIRSEEDMNRLFAENNSDIKLIIHAAGQPSHSWAEGAPSTDFTINANGTMNLLEMTRNYCPDAVFIHLSTNKVYGDRPNLLPLIEKESRWELEETHPFFRKGIDESMSLDDSTHSLYGVSKTAADLLVQEYGRTFKIKTACFRGGCVTGPLHSGAESHGFLSYLMICIMQKKTYSILGYKGKQVRDNIHSRDLVKALYAFYQKPNIGRVYNIGGGRFSNCSILEAITLSEKITGNKLKYNYKEKNRLGDHIWWVSDSSKFQREYPEWKYEVGTQQILEEIHENLRRNL